MIQLKYGEDKFAHAKLYQSIGGAVAVKKILKNKTEAEEITKF
jgi:hypothetical protein